MKQTLKRIEEALNQLEQLKHTAYLQPSNAKNSTYSFEIDRTQPQSNSALEQLSDSPTQTLETVKLLELPNLNSDSNSDAQPVADINLEMNSLPDTQTDVVDNETKLEQVVRQIQDLYHEGPLVDGWLEYYPPAPEPSAESLREISFERPIKNVEVVANLVEQESCELTGASYLICGLDEFGQQWSYPCPLEQLPSVSMAIARYHKLQQLLQQKHQLEVYLKEGSREKAEG